MEKEILTKELLMELARKQNDDELLEHYYNLALQDKLECETSDEKVMFLFILMRFQGKKLFEETQISQADFFGMDKVDENSDYWKFYQFLENIYYEISSKQVYIPENVAIEFYEDFCNILYFFGYYFRCIEVYEEYLLKYGENSFLNFLKASVIEICYINKSDDFVKMALYNYQKDLIDRCEPSKVLAGEYIFEEVKKTIYDRVENNGALGKCMKFIKISDSYKDTIAEDKTWTEEKDFYYRNNLFLNPLNLFGEFTACTNEVFDDLEIEDNNKIYFDEILEDYKMCRKETYFYYKNINNVDTRKMAMTYNYIYSIFDKIAFLLKHTYNLLIDEKKIYFNKNFFEKNIENSNVKFKNIKNDNIWPLFIIMNDIQQNREESSILQASTYEHNLLRNLIQHRSMSLVDEDKLKRNAIVLLKLARDAILYTFALIKSCGMPVEQDIMTGLGTTLQHTYLRLSRENMQK